ncbi:MAG: hypothetical protein ACJ719_03080 [Nitrososphaeraceae archaeon]
MGTRGLWGHFNILRGRFERMIRTIDQYNGNNGILPAIIQRTLVKEN